MRAPTLKSDLIASARQNTPWVTLVPAGSVALSILTFSRFSPQVALTVANSSSPLKLLENALVVVAPIALVLLGCGLVLLGWKHLDDIAGAGLVGIGIVILGVGVLAAPLAQLLVVVVTVAIVCAARTVSRGARTAARVPAVVRTRIERVAVGLGGASLAYAVAASPVLPLYAATVCNPGHYYIGYKIGVSRDSVTFLQKLSRPSVLDMDPGKTWFFPCGSAPWYGQSLSSRYFGNSDGYWDCSNLEKVGNANFAARGDSASTFCAELAGKKSS